MPSALMEQAPLAPPPPLMEAYQPTPPIIGQARVPDMAGAFVKPDPNGPEWKPVITPDAIPSPDQKAGKSGIYISANSYAPDHFEPTEQYRGIAKLPEEALFHEDANVLPVALGNVAARGVAVLPEANYAEGYQQNRGQFLAYHQEQQRDWLNSMARTESERLKAEEQAKAATTANPNTLKAAQEKSVFDENVPVEKLEGLSLSDQELVRYLRDVLKHDEADEPTKAVAKAMLQNLEERRRSNLRTRTKWALAA